MLLAEDERWLPTAAQATAVLGVGLECRRIGIDVVPCGPEAFGTAYGLGPEGASLVRPDGYIAWRSHGLPEQPADALTEALGRASSSSVAYPRKRKA